MKRIVLFTQNLDFGGVQKSVSNLANYLNSKYEVTIILAEHHKKISYDVKNIKIYTIQTLAVNLKKDTVAEKVFKYRINTLNKLLLKIKPDITISFEDYNNLILLNCKYICKKIISCRVSILDSYDNNKIHLFPSEFYYKNIKKYYPLSDKIICVSDVINNQINSLCLTTKAVTIYNGIKTIVSKDQIVPYNNFILTVGRLHKQKGQVDLIQAFKKIEKLIPQNLIIVGEGKERKTLESLIIELNLTSRIFLVGYDNPYKYIIKAKLFIFPSFYEGFSNTILEVMSCKKNIVAYKYEGSEEILFNENLCHLRNIDELAQKILFYLKNKKANDKMAEKLYLRSKEFSLENTFRKYEQEIIN